MNTALLRHSGCIYRIRHSKLRPYDAATNLLVTRARVYNMTRQLTQVQAQTWYEQYTGQDLHLGSHSLTKYAE